MKVQLTVTAGPHAGKQFVFDRRDTFLVGRGPDVHFRLADDSYLSRRQFVVELNPPRCRVLDLQSRNGITVNGRRALVVELADGDLIAAGKTVFRVSVLPDAGDPYDWSPAALLNISLPPQSSSLMEPPSVNQASGFDLRPAVPGYRLGEAIGRGRMGTVYRGERLADGAAVAVKTVIPASAVSRTQLDQFLREARELGRLEHNRIARLYDAGEADGVIFLVTEYVPGSDLGRLLAEKGALSVRTAVRLICQVLAALSYSHAEGVAHRDVRPSNVLMAGEGGKRAVKVSDFGLTWLYAVSRLSGLTLQGDTGGSPAYMAPEQVTHYRDAGPAADQYAAAAVLYRMLTGVVPHDLPEGAAEQLIHIASRPPVPIGRRKPDLPAGLADVVNRALSREPTDRFRDVNAFQRAVTPFGA